VTSQSGGVEAVLFAILPSTRDVVAVAVTLAPVKFAPQALPLMYEKQAPGGSGAVKVIVKLAVRWELLISWVRTGV